MENTSGTPSTGYLQGAAKEVLTAYLKEQGKNVNYPAASYGASI